MLSSPSDIPWYEAVEREGEMRVEREKAFLFSSVDLADLGLFIIQAC